ASNFAPPLDESRARRIRAARSMQEIMEAWYGASRGTDCAYAARQHGHHARYCGINLHSFFYRQTIEFRVFNSSVNPERVQAYVALCVALVQDARSGNVRSINKRYALGQMRAGEVTDKNAYHRFIQVLRYEAGLSK